MINDFLLNNKLHQKIITKKRDKIALNVSDSINDEKKKCPIKMITETL